MKRRDFMRVAALSVAGAATSRFGFSADARKRKGDKTEKTTEIKGDGAYSVIVIGDTHYDKAPDEVYHEGYSDPNPTREANHRKEFVRNANMWADRSRRLLRRASRLVDQDTRMAFQMGDIIQGDCGNGENHKIMLDDAFCYIKGAIGCVPLVTVAGNHDLRGSDDKVATKAYNEYMTERMSHELGKKIEKTCYSFTIGPDVYIAIDFTHPDDEEIERLINESEGARYVFVIIHSPILPYQSAKSCNWIIHGKDGKDDQRRKIRRLLAQRNAIVICGHTHTTEFARWEGDGGSITQMTVSSVWSADAVGRYELRYRKPEEYGKVVEKDGSEAAKALIAEYKDGIKAFTYAHSCGSYKLRVSDTEVLMEYYAGDSEALTETFKLR